MFLSFGNLFVNSTSIEIFTPNRANYGSHHDFVISLSNEIALPYNVPRLNIGNLPDYMLTFAESPKRAGLFIQETVNGVNWYVPNSIF